MEYKTKFSIGDHVWVVSEATHHRIVKCTSCDNTGRVTIKDEEFVCPRCDGYAARQVYAGRKYYITCHDTVVGKITIEDQPVDYGRPREKNPEISYMVDETGIGSGNNWSESQLFASREEAQAFCDSMNDNLPPNETTLREVLPPSRTRERV